MGTENTNSTSDSDPVILECRACLERVETEQSHNLFQAWSSSWEGMKNTIADDLSVLAGIQLKETDKHSKLICTSCFNNLWSACKFKFLVQENNKILRQRYPDTDTQEPAEKEWPQPIQLDTSIAGYNNPLQVEIKQEVITDDETMANGEEGYSSTSCIDMIKIEPEEIARPVTSVPPSFRVTEINGQECFEEEYLLPVKEEPESETEDVEFAADLPMDCLLCARSFSSVSGLKAHVIAQHSYQTVERRAGDTSPPRNNKYVCATCRRTFVTSTDLMVHETCHNKHICYGCSAKFDTFAQLSKHRRTCKALSRPSIKRLKTLEDVKRPQKENDTPKIEIQIEINNVTSIAEMTETLNCPLCNEVFSDPYYMKIHQEVHHTKDEADAKEVPHTKDEALDMKSDSIPMDIQALETLFTEET